MSFRLFRRLPVTLLFTLAACSSKPSPPREMDAGDSHVAQDAADPGDGGDGSDVGTPNTIPTLVGPIATVTLAEDTTVQVPLAVGGVEAAVACSDILTVTASDPNLAVLTFSGTRPDCTLTVAPAPNAFGTTSVTVTVTEGTDTAQVSFDIEVTPVNDPPRLTLPNSGLYILNEDEPNPPSYTFSISDDSPIDCSDVVMSPTAGATALAASITLAPGSAAGDCVVSASQLTPNVSGSGDVWFTVTDRDGLQAIDGITLRVLPVNDLPTITLSSSVLAFEKDSADRVTYLFSVADSDGSAECSATTATAQAGAVNLVSEVDIVATAAGISSCRLTLFIVPGMIGDGTIELVTTDNQGGTATASFAFHVYGVAAAPRFTSAPLDIYTLEDSAGAHATTFSVGDPDGFVDCSNVTAAPSPLASSITLVDDGNGACILSLTLAPNAHGDDPIVLTLTDASGMTATATFTLHVASSIDPPLLLVDTQEIVTTEDAADPVVPFTIVDVENGTTLGCQSSVVADLLSGTNGLVTGFVVADGASAGTCLLTIHLGANASGTANVRLFVTDATPRTTMAVLPLRVTAVADAPQVVFDTDPVTTQEDTPFFFYFQLADADGGPLPSCTSSVVASGVGTLIESLAVSATAVAGTCKLTVAPVADAYGMAPISVTVTGADGLQGASTVTLVVISVGDSLSISDVTTQTTDEDVPVVFNVTITGDGSIGCNAQTLTSSFGTLAFSGTTANCQVTLTPPLNVNGTLTVTLRAFDGTLEATDTFDLAITPIVDDMCLAANGFGGCEQRCLSSVNEVVTCGCYPGFVPNGPACDPAGDVTLLNEGLGLFFDVTPTGAAPRSLGMRAAGRPVEMTELGNGVFTFTVRETPGTCANGSTSSSCVDGYRLCADADQVKVAWQSDRSGRPSSWDSSLCAWILSDLGGGRVRLKNLGLAQTNPYFGYLTCSEADLCGLTLDDSTSGNTIFRIAEDQCGSGATICHPDAACSNTPAGPDCVCNVHFMGDGTACVPLDACATGNGGCAQSCIGTAPDDSAICACAPGFDLAADHRACTPRAELRLYNTGLTQFLSLPPDGSLAFFAATGSRVVMEPLLGSNGAFTFTVESAGTSYRLCTHDLGGFRAYGLPWTAPDPAPAGWNSDACGWFVGDAGNGQVRLESPLIKGMGYGYLRCDNAFDCSFNFGTDTTGNTLFSIDPDECAAGATSCDAHANCTNSVPGYACACSAGYSGDGQSCVLTDVCAIRNGGCAQRCLGTAADGAGICACFAGGVLAADGVSCDAVDGGRLFNVGLDAFIAVNAAASMPFRFLFQTPGGDVKLRPALTGPSDWTLDMESLPGTCADGSTSGACPDTYRLCVVQAGGSRLGVTMSNALVGEPADWNSPECAWRIEQAAGNAIRLKNVWLQTALPHIDYLDCTSTGDCTFTLDEDTSGNTEFVFDVDECAIGADTCDANADCTNTIGSFSCACRTGFVANGAGCDLVDACVVDNGSCSQRCVGTQAGVGVCACYPGFSLAADGRTCEPAERLRLLNDGVGYLDLDSNDFVSISSAGRELAVDPVPGTHDRFTLTMSREPGFCADGSTNVFCPDLYRLCAQNNGGVRVDPILRDARVGDPPGWTDPACTWIFEAVGVDQIRIKNLWLQQDPLFSHLDYLDCSGPNVCEFTLNESTAGSTLFTLDADSCANGTAGCDVNATCADARNGASCTCNAGYSGDGQSCALQDVCVVRNGDCQQKCLGTVAGAAVCGCVPGFALDADGKSCVARPSLRLFNVGQDEYLDWRSGPGIGALEFSPEGRNVRMEQTIDGPDTFTFTVDVTPGTCANGSQRNQCPNRYRLCARDESGFRWRTELWSDYGSKPALWDSPECKWRVEDLGNGTVRLRNLWLQQRHPSLGNLYCSDADCYFKSGTDTSANSTFALYTDECSASAPVCDAHATCRNLAGTDTCVCNENWSGNGTSCQPNDACVVNNGGCQQSCTPLGSGAMCGCWGGFDPGPNGTCVPWPNVRLVSVSFGTKVSWSSSNGLRFDSTGLAVSVESSPMMANAATLTLQAPLGDQIRICGDRNTGWVPLLRASGSPEPAGWNSVECTWLVEGDGSGAVRLRNLSIEQNFSQFDYLQCWNSANCGFTYLDEKTPQSLFSLQSDQCAVANVCGANAVCTNTATSHTCACKAGYEGDGQTCVLVDGCALDNGGCTQRCTTTPGGAVCECYPGFGGAGCAPLSTNVKLLNEGFMQFVDLGQTNQFELMSGAGADLRIESAGPNVYTFTATYGDSYRLCVRDYSGYRATTLRRGPTEPAPAGWDGPECQWNLLPAGGDRVRLKNAMLQQSHPYVDYLACRTAYDWTFTYDESLAGNTVFRIDADECALGTDQCSADANCQNVAGGYACTCKPGYSGDGRTCVPDGPCVVNNGGCAQTCTAVAGSAVCGCYPGFSVGADPTTCDSAGSVVLYNVGLGRSLNLETSGDAPYTFGFTQLGRGIRMEPATDGRRDTFTFTFDQTPGTCSDGSTSSACTDQYRMCAGNDSGYRWIETWYHDGQSLPATWDGPECTWIVERGANEEIHLRNLWLSQHVSYVDYLNCKVGYDCLFTYDDSTPATATFRVLSDVCANASNLCSQPRTCLNSGSGSGYVCSACPDGYTTNGDYACTDIDECASETCGANAHCENRPGSFACVCDDPYVGDGTTCAQPGECANANGGCAQLCAADVAGNAICSCYPGFTASGSACVPMGDLNLGNVGLELWLAMDTEFGPPYRFEFLAAPAKVRMDQVAGTRDTFTFTVRHPCGDACIDEYRLCAVHESGFRLGRILRAQGAAAPTDWNSSMCQWQVKRVGGDSIRLRNAWLQVSYPYTEYLTCEQADSSCVFDYDAQGAGNTLFRVTPDGTDLCAEIVCNATDQCHAPGVCYPLSGLCSDPVLPVGTPCDDGNRAVSGDTCSSGVCVDGGDRDGDRVANAVDQCIGDDAVGDADSDGRCDDSDTCRTVANPDQLDGDRDGIGNACDNCPSTSTTNQEDVDADGVGNLCDPDYALPSAGADPGALQNGGNPSRPACGFRPVCPGASNKTRFNGYLFGCYADEPNGGTSCLGDRWWHHLGRRIYPAVLTTTDPGTVDGVLNELAAQQANQSSPASCVNDAGCSAPATCLGNVCTMPAVKGFIDRLNASSNFLSCTGPGSYENTWPSDRVVPLETGPCSPSDEYHRIYGYRVSNTTQTPMTIWVTKARGQEGRWWTINPGEEIRFNVFGSALLFATTAEAYRGCSPNFITKTVTSYNLVDLSAGQSWGSIRVPQSSPVELVRYTVAASGGGGSLVITRDRELTLDVHLYVYPNYFGVGTPPFPQYSTSDIAQLIITLARNVNGFSPVKEGGLRVISPERYPVLDCEP